MIDLENEYLKVTIAPHGAELQSLFDKTTQTERLWSGDPQFWGKKSPVLFPIVGALKDNTYYFEDQEYHLPRHGFARDMVFNVSFASDTKAIFTLNDTVETRKIYPFTFDFSIHYQLDGATLTCTYSVFNPGKTPLLFSVGAHPAFAITTSSEIRYSDYELDFNSDQVLHTHKIVDNLISEEVDTVLLKDNKLTLAHELFYEDALVIKGLKSDRISILNKHTSRGLHFNFEAFPYFGIWAAKDADFVCLEPWCGIADATTHNKQLKDKEGIVNLEPENNWKRSWNVMIFQMV